MNGVQGYDQEQIYITAQDLVRDEYFICSDPQNPQVKFYYIPADYMEIVEQIIGDDPFAAYSVIYSYPGTGTPVDHVILGSSQPAESNPMLGLGFMPNSICHASDKHVRIRL